MVNSTFLAKLFKPNGVRPLPEHSAVLKDSAGLFHGFICYIFTSFPSKLNPNCYSTLRIHHMESLKIQPIPHYLTFLNEEGIFFSFLYFHNSKGD